MNDDEKIKKFLVKGEEIVLSDSAGADISVRGKLVLTTKRLFLCGAKSLFKRDYVIKKQLELKDISNVQGDLGKTSLLGVTDNSWLVIKPKVGEELRFMFDTGSMALWDFNNAQTIQMTKITNWVNSIKLELLKLEGNSKACNKCSKQLPIGNFEFCPYCGSELEK